MTRLVKSAYRIFSRPVLLHYILPVLMIYLVTGTVSQKYIGLHQATRIFFSDIILWFGPIPLPGFPVLITLIFISLAVKLSFKSPWNVKNSGIILTHIGAILLLFGGLLTALFSSEGYLDLSEGQVKAFVTDYHTRMFVVVDDKGQMIEQMPHENLKEGDRISLLNLPIKLNVLESCRNCKISKREDASDHTYGMARHMSLSAETLEHEDENNMSGLTFRLSGAEQDGIYLVLENVLKYPEFAIAGKTYRFILRKEQRPLPFQIELIDFERSMHPGTDLAKAYQSHVRIYDGPVQWESVIRMNEPLRYKGYTFFQSSFFETPEGEVSVLAVVRNAGRTFPYISGLAMCLGILIHLFVRRNNQIKNRREKADAL